MENGKMSTSYDKNDNNQVGYSETLCMHEGHDGINNALQCTNLHCNTLQSQSMADDDTQEKDVSSKQQQRRLQNEVGNTNS